jgi:hypothetical protein
VFEESVPATYQGTYINRIKNQVIVRMVTDTDPFQNQSRRSGMFYRHHTEFDEVLQGQPTEEL